MRQFIVVVVVLTSAGCVSRSTDEWLRQLKDPDVLKRREAIRALKEHGDQPGLVVPALADLLQDENAYVRRDAAMLLGNFATEARPAVPALREALKDKDARVRGAALTALTKVGERPANKAGVKK
jgi:HEAT repeat protein